MNEHIKQMTNEMEYNNPTPELEIEKIQKEYNVCFPNDYKNFMLETNGAEGPIGKEEYLAIFNIEEVIWYNTESPLKESFPELFFFASTRGGYVFAFNTRSTPMKIVKVDDDAINYEEIEDLADTFEKFIEHEYLFDSDNM